MASRLVAAALAVALLGCGGAEPKRATGDGGEEEVMHTDRLDAADCRAAAAEFGRKVSEKRAGGMTIQVVQVTQVTNQADTSFDLAVFQRAVEEELTRAGLEVKVDPRSDQGRRVEEERAYADGTDGESEMEALESEKRAEGFITLFASRERLDETTNRYVLRCQLVDRSRASLVMTSTAVVKTKE